MNKIKCTNCNEEKTLDNFYYDSKRNYYDPKCKKCSCEQIKKYRELNLEKFIKKDKIFYEKNKDKIIENKHKYYEKNKDLIISKNSEYSKNNREKINIRQNERRKIPEIKLRKMVSEVIRQQLKSKNLKKEHSCMKYLFYTVEQLKQHLESLFEPWMNWKNWGQYIKETWDDNNSSTWTWQIDHIIPQSDLPYTSMEDENFKKCWALENLRPYSAKQNIIDQNRKNKYFK